MTSKICENFEGQIIGRSKLAIRFVEIGNCGYDTGSDFEDTELSKIILHIKNDLCAFW